MSETALPHDDWDRHWQALDLATRMNPAQRYRIRLVLGRLRLDRGPARVLDVGSGQGDFAAELRARSPQVEIAGLELSRSGCEIARRKVPDATFMQCNLLEPAPPPREYRRWATHAVCSEVLEHVDRPGALLANAAQYLAPGCRFVVTVPGGPMSAFDRHIGHRRHYTPGSLEELLAKAGFEVEGVSAAGFPFHTLYRLTVIARGGRLVSDVASGPDGPSSRLARLVMRSFDPLFRLNLPSSPWGWQIVATGRVPA